jgi:hypothetical protein
MFGWTFHFHNFGDHLAYCSLIAVKAIHWLGDSAFCFELLFIFAVADLSIFFSHSLLLRLRFENFFIILNIALTCDAQLHLLEALAFSLTSSMDVILYLYNLSDK